MTALLDRLLDRLADHVMPAVGGLIMAAMPLAVGYALLQR